MSWSANRYNISLFFMPPSSVKINSEAKINDWPSSIVHPMTIRTPRTRTCTGSEDTIEHSACHCQIFIESPERMCLVNHHHCASTKCSGLLRSRFVQPRGHRCVPAQAKITYSPFPNCTAKISQYRNRMNTTRYPPCSYPREQHEIWAQAALWRVNVIKIKYS